MECATLHMYLRRSQTACLGSSSKHLFVILAVFDNNDTVFIFIHAKITTRKLTLGAFCARCYLFTVYQINLYGMRPLSAYSLISILKFSFILLYLVFTAFVANLSSRQRLGCARYLCPSKRICGKFCFKLYWLCILCSRIPLCILGAKSLKINRF